MADLGRGPKKCRGSGRPPQRNAARNMATVVAAVYRNGREGFSPSPPRRRWEGAKKGWRWPRGRRAAPTYLRFLVYPFMRTRANSFEKGEAKDRELSKYL